MLVALHYGFALQVLLTGFHAQRPKRLFVRSWVEQHVGLQCAKRCARYSLLAHNTAKSLVWIQHDPPVTCTRHLTASSPPLSTPVLHDMHEFLGRIAVGRNGSRHLFRQAAQQHHPWIRGQERRHRHPLRHLLQSFAKVLPFAIFSATFCANQYSVELLNKFQQVFWRWIFKQSHVSSILTALVHPMSGKLCKLSCNKKLTKCVRLFLQIYFCSSQRSGDFSDIFIFAKTAGLQWKIIIC